MVWLVVNFLTEETVEAVPLEWYIEISQECYWPPERKREKIRYMIRKRVSPCKDWELYKVQVLGEYDNFAIAEQKANKAKHSDNLTSHSEELKGRGQRIRKKKTFLSESEYESDRDFEPESSESECGSRTLSFPVFDNLRKKSDADSKHTNKKVEAVNKKELHNKGTSEDSFSSGSHKGNLSQKSDDSEHANKKVKAINKKDLYNKGTSEDSFSSGSYKGNLRKKTDDDSEHTKRVEAINRKEEHNKGTSEGSHKEIPLERSNSIITHQLDVASVLEFQRQVLRQLHIINLKISEVFNYLYDVYPKQKNPEADNDVPRIFSIFPVSENGLGELEQWLTEEANQNILAKELGRIGGQKVPDITRRIMYKIFSNEVGNLYSWEGAKKKKVFKNLNIANVILKAVRKNKLTEDATDNDIILVIKSWLVRSKDRMKNKNAADNILAEDDDTENNNGNEVAEL